MEPNTKSIPRVALVGIGHWGKNLARNFFELGALATVCDLDTDTLSTLSRQYPGVKTTQRLSEVLADSGINAVVIATPSPTHYQLAKEVLLAGKDVLVEKPLALRYQDGEELVSLADKQERILMVDHVLHYHPAVEKLKELISEGVLGEIQYIYSNRLGFGKIRREENVVWSFTSHDVSLILAVTGAFPRTVAVHAVNSLQKEVADVTVTHLAFEGGLRGHIFASWLHPYKEQKFIIVGSKKMLVFDDLHENKLVLYPHLVKWEGVLPIAEKAEAELVAIPQTEPLRQSCAHFLECVRDRKQPLTDGHEALRVLKVLQACQTSMDQGGKTLLFEV